MAERLNGYRILILEAREEAQFSRLLTEQGADVLACPMLAINDVPDPAAMEAWIRVSIAHPFDDLVLMTGKGLRRQFHQIDLEVLGAPEPGADIEVISVAADILDRLGILDRCVLKLNSLGDPESRTAYRKVLVDYYSAHVDKLSDDSRDRLQRNPLRILDSKD